MKATLLLIFVFFFSMTCIGQEKDGNSIIINDEIVYPENISNSSNEDLGYEKVARAFGSSDIVILSECDHGDLTSIETKQSLIDYLHSQCGFNVLILEDSFIGLNILYSKSHKNSSFELYRSLTNDSLMWNYMPKIFNWSDSVRKANNDTFFISGCDISKFDYVLSELKEKISLFDCKIPDTDDFLSFVDYYKNFASIPFHKSKNRAKKFFNYCDFLSSIFSAKYGNCNYYSQYLINMKTVVSYYLASKKQKYRNIVSMWNIRDRQMAENIIWLIDHKYNDEKVIISISSFHSMRNVDSIASQKVADRVTVGQILFDYYGNRLYSITFIGNRGKTGRSFKRTNCLNTRDSSYLESKLNSKGFSRAFINFREMKNNKPFNADVLYGQSEYQVGVWNHVFDGVIFNDSIYPAQIENFNND